MADQINTTSTPQRSGGNSGMAFIVGMLVVVVAVLGFVVFRGGGGGEAGGKDINVTIESPEPAAEAGAATEGAAEGN